MTSSIGALQPLVGALRTAGQLVSAPPEDGPVSGVTDDSRRVRSGVLFCAVEGTAHDGHAFVADAARRGAVAAVVTRALEVSVPQIVVRDSRAALSVVASAWHGCPGDRLRLVGVTGTNGKTTTVALLRHLLNADGDVASVGTLGAYDGDGERLPGYGPLTTPGALELHAVLADLAARGVGTVVMEASSHALDQQRLHSLSLEAAVYTNLTHDHLDYHKTLEAYRRAKLRLSSYVAEGGVEVVNADDAAWRELGPRASVRRLTYGRRGAGDVQVVAAQTQADASALTIRFGDVDVAGTVPLPGDFNVSNALAACAAAWALGVAPDAAMQRLGGAPPVAGRMERVADGAFQILRDYAHTPDALERAIAALRPITAGRVIVLFGAGGDRDRAKRPEMGAVVARGADLAIVTSDNPRTESPERIIDDIESGMGDATRLRVVDRREAIRQAVALMEPGDCLLLAGKGHETYQVVGLESHPFDEAELVRTALAERGDA